MGRTNFAAYAIGLPVAIALLGATMWLWGRYGMGVFVEHALGAIANCF